MAGVCAGAGVEEEVAGCDCVGGKAAGDGAAGGEGCASRSAAGSELAECDMLCCAGSGL